MRLLNGKKIIFFISIFFCLVKNSSAQYNEVGLFFGAANYKGELSPHLFNTDFIHFAMGGFYRHNWNRHWSYNFELNYGRISGDDALATTGFEKNRNLSFYSDIIEFSPLIEFNFFPYETGNSEYPFTPYIFTGISVLKFNPKTTYNGNEVELQPLGTEGQGLNGTDLYNRVVIAIPIGGGIKIDLGKFGLGVELGARRTYTDYLDDVSTVYPDQLKLAAAHGPLAAALSDRSLNKNDTSTPLPTVTGKQRGNSKDNDWYIFAGITMYVRLGSPGRDSCHPFIKRNYQ